MNASLIRQKRMSRNLPGCGRPPRAMRVIASIVLAALLCCSCGAPSDSAGADSPAAATPPAAAALPAAGDSVRPDEGEAALPAAEAAEATDQPNGAGDSGQLNAGEATSELANEAASPAAIASDSGQPNADGATLPAAAASPAMEAALQSNADEATSALNVYLPPAFFGEVMRNAVAKFEEAYPSVAVGVADYSDMTQPDAQVNYVTILRSELAAGKGPDLLFTHPEGGVLDIWKSASSGIYCDLNGFIQADEEFSLADFNASAMEAGVVGGRRLFAPVFWNFCVLLTTRASAAYAGFDLDKAQTFGGLCEEITRHNGAAQDAPSQRVFFDGFGIGLYLTYYAGLRAVDYESKAVLIDAPEFKQAMDACKSLYRQELAGRHDNDGYSWSYSADDIKAVRENRYIFTSAIGIGAFYDAYGYFAHDQEPVYFPLPSAGGGYGGTVAAFAAIPNGSPNKANAYRLMKILLSDDIQSGGVMAAYPVRASSLQAISKDPLSLMASQLPDGSAFKEPTTEALRTEFLDVVDAASKVAFPQGAVLYFVTEEMEPYFKGDADYGSCLGRLRNKLELYLDE
jgi:hypothetical protein